MFSLRNEWRLKICLPYSTFCSIFRSSVLFSFLFSTFFIYLVSSLPFFTYFPFHACYSILSVFFLFSFRSSFCSPPFFSPPFFTYFSLAYCPPRFVSPFCFDFNLFFFVITFALFHFRVKGLWYGRLLVAFRDRTESYSEILVQRTPCQK